MGALIQVFTFLFAIFPTWFAVLVLAFVAFLTVLIVINVVGFILKAVPFL